MHLSLIVFLLVQPLHVLAATTDSWGGLKSAFDESTSGDYVSDGSLSTSAIDAVLDGTGLADSIDRALLYRSRSGDVVVIGRADDTVHLYRVGATEHAVLDEVIIESDDGGGVTMKTADGRRFVRYSDANTELRRWFDWPTPCEAILGVWGVVECALIGTGIGTFVGGVLAGAGCGLVYLGLSWMCP